MPKRTDSIVIAMCAAHRARFKYILIVPNRFIYNDEKRRRVLRISLVGPPMTTEFSRVDEPVSQTKTVSSRK